jgi:hypothetical protein
LATCRKLKKVTKIFAKLAYKNLQNPAKNSMFLGFLRKIVCFLGKKYVLAPLPGKKSADTYVGTLLTVAK